MIRNSIAFIVIFLVFVTTGVAQDVYDQAAREACRKSVGSLATALEKYNDAKPNSKKINQIAIKNLEGDTDGLVKKCLSTQLINDSLAVIEISDGRIEEILKLQSRGMGDVFDEGTAPQMGNLQLPHAILDGKVLTPRRHFALTAGQATVEISLELTSVITAETPWAGQFSGSAAEPLPRQFGNLPLIAKIIGIALSIVFLPYFLSLFFPRAASRDKLKILIPSATLCAAAFFLITLNEPRMVHLVGALVVAVGSVIFYSVFYEKY